jgi:hypothetical protein
LSLWSGFPLSSPYFWQTPCKTLKTLGKKSPGWLSDHPGR